MPQPKPIGAADVVRRQLRRVRRQHNLHELQRAAYGSIGAVATTATLLLVLALFASTRTFAVATWLGGLAAVLTAVWNAQRLRRRWIRAADAPAWIERAAGLGGRLQTLIELEARPLDASSAFFVPLLERENAERIASWQPGRLIGGWVPRRPLAGALAAAAAFLLALRLAPSFEPRVPELEVHEGPVDWSVGAPPSGTTAPDRLVVAPAGPATRGRDGSAGVGADPAPASPLTRLPAELQERIRRELWGQAWERMRSVMDRLAAAEERARRRRSSPELEDEPSDEGDWELAELPDGAGGGPRGDQESTEASGEPGRRLDRDRNGADSHESDVIGEGGASRSATAGNDTDPNVFGTAELLTPLPGTEPFTLGLAARMRTRQPGDAARDGAAPPPDTDHRPALAARQRGETAAHRMPVPAAYEGIVREVFAHRDPP